MLAPEPCAEAGPYAACASASSSSAAAIIAQARLAYASVHAPRGRCEIGAEPLLKRPDQRLTDGCIVLGADAVGGMAAAELTDRRHNGRQLVERGDHGTERRHELRALSRHVSPEQGPQVGIELEQTTIEQGRRVVLDGRYLGEAALDELDLFRGHGDRSDDLPQTPSSAAAEGTLAAACFRAMSDAAALGFSCFRSCDRPRP
jgi:hypothetical protein